jgi:recombination protein RecA
MLAGLVTELSSQGGTAPLTLAFSLVLGAQRERETVAWVTDSHSSFFPPDAASAGVDVEALAVVRVPGVPAIFKVADRLVRSGAFGLVVLDLGADPRVSGALVARLSGLAKRHDTAVLCLTEKRREASSLGSLVAVRGEARRRLVGEGRFLCHVEALKDRRGSPGWIHEEVHGGPEGLY